MLVLQEGNIKVSRLTGASEVVTLTINNLPLRILLAISAVLFLTNEGLVFCVGVRTH